MAPPPIASDRSDTHTPSLAEVHGSIPTHALGLPFWRRLGAFMGPGYLVAVGYMDPGNWATDIAGGSAFGYTLLSVILLSNIMAMVLQALSAKLGIIGGVDLAQACRRSYPRPINLTLWALCELAIIACDLAEVIGTAIALNLLFGLPLVLGIVITAFDVLLILGLQRFGFRKLEAFVIALLAIIAGCFAAQLIFAQPSIAGILNGLIPRAEIVTNPAMLYVAIGILGATVMPHNLYLHSSIVQTRAFAATPEAKRDALKMATIDSSIALFLALFINAAILILAAATFHSAGRTDVAEIQDAYQLLSPMLGVGVASTLFAVALLASGQNSTVTGTLAGQIVMEGFLNIRLPMWLRRMVTRLLAIVPAAIVAALYGESGTARLLVLSQVVLSLQLPFAMVPLVQFTQDPARMGPHANRGWLKYAAWAICGIVIALNVTLLWNVFAD